MDARLSQVNYALLLHDCVFTNPPFPKNAEDAVGHEEAIHVVMGFHCPVIVAAEDKHNTG